MGKSRHSLQEMLEDILGSDHVYYQPPSSIHLEYPAIVYSRQYIDNRYADNAVYLQNDRYEIVYIDRKPDAAIVRILSQLPNCAYNRHYIADGLNHDVYTLYY